MNNTVAKYTLGDRILEVHYDTDPESPREWSPSSKMVCFHKRYNLGDEHSYKVSDFSSWDELRKGIEKEEDIAVILPVYMYDHSGIAISTTPYSCSWDSGQIGWIYMTKKDARKEYSKQRISQKTKGLIEKMLKSEVEVYSNYLNGDVFGYILKDEKGNEIDSCWGFFGLNFATNGICEYAGEEWLDAVS